MSHYPSLLRSLAATKRAAAQANAELGDLDPAVAAAIEQACGEVIDGRHDEHFRIDVFQGGAGTSTNMNMNEVVANRAAQILGHPLGSYAVVHPNDHVNRSQSTNDVYPTALRMAIRADSGGLRSALVGLADAFDAKGAAFADVVKLGRTQLQDAVPMTLGQELGAFATTIREDLLRLDEGTRLLSEVNLGGTAIGTGIAADPRFRRIVLERLAAQGETVIPAENLIEASWDAGAFVTFSGVLKRIAVKLSKIANDLRLLSSGPRGGIGEIRLPAMQAGSTQLEVAQRHGVKMVYGTDLIGPLHRHQSMEFRIRGEVLPAIEVIRSATSYAAELFNMVGEIGTVAVGARADPIAVDGDPLRDLGLLQAPAKLALIMKDGDIYRNAVKD